MVCLLFHKYIYLCFGILSSGRGSYRFSIAFSRTRQLDHFSLFFMLGKVARCFQFPYINNKEFVLQLNMTVRITGLDVPSGTCNRAPSD